MRAWTIVAACFFAFAGCGSSEDEPEGCDARGCPETELCNPETLACEPDCTKGGCEGDTVCDALSRQCIERCKADGCAEASHCAEATGLCEADCKAGSCEAGQWCDPGSGTCAPAVVFGDEALEACVRGYHGLEQQPIVPADVAGLTSLECADAGIDDLTGLEHFVGLEHLTLWENHVADLAPLAGLTSLQTLQLGNNEISDLSPLEGMTTLEALGLADNRIEDLAPLSGLTTLSWLNLDHNLVADVDALEDLDELTWLTLEGNEVSGSELDAIGTGDADVYFARRGGDGGGSFHRAPGATGERGRNGRPVLNFTTDPSGVVTFDVLVGDRSYEARREYRGEVLFDGSRFTLRLAGLEHAIGEVVGREVFLCSGAFAHRCDFAFGSRLPGPGDRRPGTADRAPEPVFTVSLSLRPLTPFIDPPENDEPAYGEYHGLMDPFVLASPNQFDAGSCLFMSNTGAMEILLNQRAPVDGIGYDGDTDLSERFLMNASNHVYDDDVPYSITDVVNTYNAFGGALLNRDYPFTAGYVRDTARGLVPAGPNDDGAYFSCQYNWIDELPDDWQDTLTVTPEVGRTLLFVDPNLDENSVWNVGLMNEDVVERIKFEVRTKHAPVIVVYNHYLYWHADIVVGYDDARPSGGCPMVEDSLEYFEQQGATTSVSRIEQHMQDEGGCDDSGVFYVRDSIYAGTSEELWYDYSDVYEFRERYSQRIIVREYDWVRYLANHAYSVHRR